MQLPPRRYLRTSGLLTGVAVLVVTTASPAHAAPLPVSGLAATLAPHGVQLTWTGSGTGTPVVRDVTGLAEPYDPTSSGRLVAAGSTADCPAATCAVDAGFTNTATQTYAVWAADLDGSLSPYVTLAVPVLPPLATETALDVPVASILTGRALVLTGHLTRGGLPLSGAHLWLRSNVLGSTTVGTLAGATSGADGSVSISLVPTRSRAYWLSFPGDAYSTASTSLTRVVRLQPRVTAVVSPTTIPWKQQAVVKGTVWPNLAGGTVAVQVWNGSAWSGLAYRTVTSTSTWSLAVAPPVGTHRYRALLLGRTSYLSATSSVATLYVTPRTLYQGLSGPDVLAVEKRLAALRYDVGRVDGYFDYDLRHAVLAFQKVERLSRTGKWAAAERTRVLKPVGFVTRYRTSSLSVEVDITRQVLVLAKNGVVLKIVDVSTGSEGVYYQEGVRQVAHTPRGSFRIYKKINGIRVSPLGELYKPSYFYRGYAIHGNSSVPAYPASHGCVRITNNVADRLFSTLATGTRVFVYDE
jgi:hypothetical protein